MSFTYDQAIAELKTNAAKYATRDGLIDLIKKLSVNVPGATADSPILLYSGGVVDGVPVQLK